jgi:hypothetical protein
MLGLLVLYLAFGHLTIFTQATGFFYTGSGGLENMCPIACYDDYFLSGGTCQPKTFVVQFQVAVTLPPASTFNVRKYIESMASLAGVSGCTYTPTVVTPNILYETECQTPKALIRATVDTPSTVITSSFSQMERRLLAAAGTANVITEIRIESNSTKANVVQQSVTASAVSEQLTVNAVGSVTSVSAPTLVVREIVPPTVARSTSTTRPAATTTTSWKSYITTTPPPSQPPSSPPATTPVAETASNVGLIIGVVAGVLGVLLAALVTAFAVLGAKTPKKQAAPQPNTPKQPMKAQSLFNHPTPNRTALMYSVPQQLYPVYPLQQIQILEARLGY